MCSCSTLPSRLALGHNQSTHLFLTLRGMTMSSFWGQVDQATRQIPMDLHRVKRADAIAAVTTYGRVQVQEWLWYFVQAWRVIHPPKRGRCGWRPLVHSGFLKSWTRNAFNSRVVERVLQISREAPSGKTPDDPFRVIITGAACVLRISFCKLNLIQTHAFLDWIAY